MFQNYLRIALRKLVQQRAYALLNVLGLGLSIGCSLVIISAAVASVQIHLAQEAYWGSSSEPFLKHHPMDAQYPEWEAGQNLLSSETSREYLVNEILVKSLKLASPKDTMNKQNIEGEKKAPIAGIIRDYHKGSIAESISPIVFSSRADSYSTCTIPPCPSAFD